MVERMNGYHCDRAEGHILGKGKTCRATNTVNQTIAHNYKENISLNMYRIQTSQS